MNRILFVVSMLVGCGVDRPLPTCASLGCPIAPSGAAEQWEPCTDAVCWCRDASAGDEPAMCELGH